MKEKAPQLLPEANRYSRTISPVYLPLLRVRICLMPLLLIELVIRKKSDKSRMFNIEHRYKYPRNVIRWLK